jgi:hypothetical protein
MRVLLLHPDDDPENELWARERWDRVIDLGFAGEDTYRHWSGALQCPVDALPKLRIAEFSAVREAFAAGYGRVVDQYGLDWWELIAIRFHEQLAFIMRLKKLCELVNWHDEVHITRDGNHAETLRGSLRQLRCLAPETSKFGKVRRLISSLRALGVPQIVQTLGDKHDAGYRIRRRVAARWKPQTAPVVLLPTAHVTAARIAISYARALMDTNFLLVATRKSGWINDVPPNASSVMLASYAPGNCDQAECRELLAAWGGLELILETNAETTVLKRLGSFLQFPKMLRDGLAIRDAWLRVFEREPVSAVLCTDDANPYTHIPLLLARRRGLPTVACHHGALDGQNLVKRSHAEIVLAKGEMERDYLVNTCGISAQKVEVGAPPIPRWVSTGMRKANAIVFFSEPYELDGGRAREIYREILPQLARLALRMELKLIVKLHPMESASERTKLVRRCLSSTEVQSVTVVTGRLSDELLGRARLAVTVQSTAAVDCRLRGIPVFLCAWLDCGHFGYLDQFVKFGAGVPLHSPAEIAKAPELLAEAARDIRDLWEAAPSEELERLLTRGLELSVAV